MGWVYIKILIKYRTYLKILLFKTTKLVGIKLENRSFSITNWKTGSLCNLLVNRSYGIPNQRLCKG